MIWTIFAICLIASFLLSGLESAILSVHNVRVQHHAKQKASGAARRLALMMDHRSRLLSCVLLANTAANLTAFAILTISIANAIPWDAWGYLFAFFVCLPISIIWVEFLPKSLFRNAPYRALLWLNFPLWMLYVTIGPVMQIGSHIPRLFGLGEPDSPPGDDADREEFKFLTNIIERQGSIGRDERKMIENLVDFGNTQISEIMIPMAKTTAVPAGMSIEQVVALARETRLDEFPLISPEGQLSGLVDVLDIIKRSNPKGRAGAYCKQIVKAPADASAASVFRRIRQTGGRLAAVVDHEDNRPLGIVSAEDIIGAMLNKA